MISDSLFVQMVDIPISVVAGVFDWIDGFYISETVTLGHVLYGALFVSITLYTYHRLKNPATPEE